MNRSTKPIIFDYKKAKATQAILWLLDKHGGSMDKLKLVKLIFYADREHLARYGRPIVGGSYVAMQHGPVSSDLLDHLNEATPQSGSLFTIEAYRILANGLVDEDKLSESDIEVLANVNNEYGGYDGFTLRDITHQLKAWNKNYPDKNSKTSNPLPYEDLFLDLGDDSFLDIIRDDQEAWAELGW